ncbi:thymidine kinase [Paenibacillus thalictri]|uniref:Thymidine kinase n=1 Tax=Paenibacillus thalictri TaxID=2527873 RepID=A0A4Q9DS04_9BACL|nr:thymidine kinase [Paenibacillus thalictri]TBL78665.1 thymidine kinase [Paenibacillus thalictri]
MAQLYFRYGTMNSGKSIDVLKVAHNYEEQGKKVLLFTPVVNNRDGVGKVASRIGMQKEGIVVDEQMDMVQLAAAEKPNCILVDEAQFLSKQQVLQLAEIVDALNIPVIAYGLRADFVGDLFEGSYHLMALADKIEEIKTVCWFCDKKATMNMRCKDGIPVFEGEQIQIGGNESYIPVCRKCYSVKRKQSRQQ